MPALLALVVAMFSLTSRPGAHVSDLAPDAFSGADACADTREFTQRFPDRRAGTPGDEALADVVEGRFRALGLETSRQRFFADVDGRRLRHRSKCDRSVATARHLPTAASGPD